MRRYYSMARAVCYVRAVLRSGKDYGELQVGLFLPHLQALSPPHVPLIKGTVATIHGATRETRLCTLVESRLVRTCSL